MAISNCEKCGNLFNKTVKNICPNCLKEEDQMFETVKKYLKKNKTVTQIEQISEGTGVSVELITKFFREGRLQSAGGSEVSYGCTSCGTPITTGKVCKHCESNLTQLQSTMKQTEKPKTEAQPISFYSRIRN